MLNRKGKLKQLLSCLADKIVEQTTMLETLKNLIPILSIRQIRVMNVKIKQNFQYFYLLKNVSVKLKYSFLDQVHY